MKVINRDDGKVAEIVDFNGIIDDPDMVTYEIAVKVVFYESPSKEVLDYLELSAEDVILMFRQFKAGGFLPEKCRLILKTTLKKDFLSDPSKG